MPRRKIDWYGPRLRQLREAAGLSQADLGKQVNVAGSQINKLETNVNQPTLATALAIAEALGMPIEAFPAGAGGDQDKSMAVLKGTSRRAPKATPATPPAADLE